LNAKNQDGRQPAPGGGPARFLDVDTDAGKQLPLFAAKYRQPPSVALRTGWRFTASDRFR